MARLRRLHRVVRDSLYTNERLRRLIDVVPHPLVLVNQQGRITLTNATVAKSFDYSERELLGKSLTTLFAARWRCGLPERLAHLFVQRSRYTIDADVTCVSKDGAEFPVEINVGPVVLDREVQLLLVIVDITSRKQWESKLRRSREHVRRQNHRLRKLASTDPLTGCLNRRAFWKQGEGLCHDAQPAAAPISCIMMDLDHFKTINDRYGHAAGDEVLRHVGGILHEHVRKPDLACRYGGEEFCLLLPDADIEHARMTAEVLRMAISASLVGNVRVTVSFGIACHDAAMSELETLVRQADEALYAAKNAGRNRVVTWQDRASPFGCFVD